MGERTLVGDTSTCPFGDVVWRTCYPEEHDRRAMEIAAINADRNNWSWDKDAGRGCKKAAVLWQAFATKWRETHMGDTPTLDLSDVGAISTLPILTNTVLIRDCYREAEKVVWRRAAGFGFGGGVIFTGQPGIGKTAFLWYLLVRLLQQGQVILFHLPGPSCLLFYFDRVYRLNQDDAILPRMR
ncbi:hypothetical protein BD310DRAFT_952477 [Dichomitus squalens]|uniref:Uncharacterized protein n=1 Tax=Dichomitus squalens TaxID=114155 RepID=A0A4Q9PDC2_9APHY|nr:hypothetical protein BD310DRAFT_952477 [Dichomitus squalens]